MRRKQSTVAFVLILIFLAFSAISQTNSGITCTNNPDCFFHLEEYLPEELSCVNGECIITLIDEEDNQTTVNSNTTSNQTSITTQTTTSTQDTEINKLKSDVAKIKTDISSVKNSIQTQTGSTTILKNDVNVVKNQVSNIQNQLTQINNQLSNSLNQIQNSVSGVSTGLVNLQEEINSTQTGLTNLEEDLQSRRSKTIILFFLIVLAVAGGTFYFIYRKKRPAGSKKTQPDVISYITEHIKQGIKFPEIKNNLLQAGWSSEDIDAAYQKTMKHNYQKYLKKSKSSAKKPAVTTAAAKKKAFDPKKGVAIAIISVLLMVGVLLILKEATGKAIHLQYDDRGELAFSHDEIYNCTVPHILSDEGTCCLDNRTFTEELCESNQHCMDFVYSESITQKIENVFPNIKKFCLSSVCVVEGIGNNQCDTEEEYDINKAEISAEVCDNHNQCVEGELCIDKNCGTFQTEGLSNQIDCVEQSCNFNNVEISTSDGNTITLAPKKSSYAATGAIAWTIMELSNYCSGNEVRIPIEIEKKGMVCYNQEGQEISCNQKTNLICNNNADCSQCLELYNSPCTCSSSGAQGFRKLNTVSTTRIKTLSKEIITLEERETSSIISHPYEGINEKLNRFRLTLNNINEFCFG